jgi:hypothetical protein
VSGGSSVTSFSPSITSSTTYYAQGRNTTTGCVSATRLTVGGTVNAVPSITLSGGAASQNVNQGTAISAMTYTANNATSISRSGNLPSGVTGSISGLTYRINGTPTAAGTFGYTVTASNTNGCPSASQSGTITVKIPAPSGAYSSNTWTYGSQIWSDRIVMGPTSCSSTATLSTATSPPAQYKISGGRYYYNWVCAYNNRTTLCPDPWALPTGSQLNTLLQNATAAVLAADWLLGGRATGNTIEHTTNGWYWSTDESTSAGWAWGVQYSGSLAVYNSAEKYKGLQVRCVR